MAPGFSSFSSSNKSTPSKPPPSSKSSPYLGGGGSGKKVPFSQKQKRNGNTSILNFFQRADGPPRATSTQARITLFATKISRDGTGTAGGSGGGVVKRNVQNGSGEGGLFLEDRGRRADQGDGDQADVEEDAVRERPKTPDDDLWGGGDENGDDGLFTERENEEERFNENGGSVKRRKVDSPSSSLAGGSKDGEEKNKTTTTGSIRRSGPFIDESDSEDDLDAFREIDVPVEAEANIRKQEREKGQEEDNVADDTLDNDSPQDHPLVREASHMDDLFADFDDLEADPGEDALEQPLEEQEDGLGLERYDSNGGGPGEAEAPACPICQADLAGLSDTEVSVHVNNCLDGKPNAETNGNAKQPNKKPPTKDVKLTRVERAAIARPGQRDPFAMKTGATSAFSKMMAANAEDTAWATAAAKEAASRGKQAYERTCPFYKILPGFSITVDAFRYGAVDGCSAYFLSHFHSDHYVGLTASWRHGPIYCSKVTGNLVRQQLRVDPKWVVDLEFEKTTEVPGTDGVRVTLIPANHCPGSALFLFEKRMGQGPNARTQRILHCGDFRACPAHIQHPLLRPEAVDGATGKPRQQRIDVCYLDTTYLSPKYSFPSQEDVITACADLCVRLQNGEDPNGMRPDRQNGGAGRALSQFLSKGDPERPQGGANGRLLVVIGTYSIGKERICVGIARALGCKIYAPPAKQRVCSCLEDDELSSLLTDDPLAAQIHMQTMFEIRADTLAEYLASMKPHFSRVVGFRPTGWNYRPPSSGRQLDHPPVSAVLHDRAWRTRFTVKDLVPQRGSTKDSSCFGVPYSEHSSFRELSMFCCALRIGRVIPTVNVGSRASRERMRAWIERWEGEKRRAGLFRGEW